jgi:ATP adenylyltransferase
MTGRLWAPWRMQYVASARQKPEGCLFCQKAREPVCVESMVLFRGEHAIAMLNAFPYTNGHLMVAPIRHTADMNELTDAELLQIAQFVRHCVNLLHEAYHPDGFHIGVNLGRAAGAGIEDHIHWHIVPAGTAIPTSCRCWQTCASSPIVWRTPIRKSLKH